MLTRHSVSMLRKECTLNKMLTTGMLTMKIPGGAMFARRSISMSRKECTLNKLLTMGMRNAVMGMALYVSGYGQSGDWLLDTMGLSVDPDRRIWSALVRYEVAVAVDPTLVRVTRTHDHGCRSAHLCMMMFAAVICMGVTLYWIFRLVGRVLASNMGILRHSTGSG